MIVFMATGNTPILDLSPFNGFRTLSANIAVEITEAPVDRNAIPSIIFMCRTVVSPDIPAEHAGRTGSPTSAQTLRPLLNTGRRVGRFWRQGEPFVWATGAALALTLLLTFALLAVVLWNGLGVFWPHAVAEVELADGKKLLGEQLQTEINADTGVESVKFKVGNMEDGPAFRWIEAKTIRSTVYPKDAYVLERLTNMNYYGFLRKIVLPSTFGRGAGG